MKIGDFLKTTKGKVVTIGGTTVVAVGIALAVLFMGGGYRSILVEQVEGIVNVIGERNNGQAYSGQRLYSGDDVTVHEASSMTMCMDNDKYVYADANTHFTLKASSAKENSKIKISLDKGSELNVLKSKLGPDDSYEVETPNSTMSVRGTTFRVTVYEGPDGLVYTLLEVEEGVVLARLMTRDGTFNGIEREFRAGESALIRGNSDFSEFVLTRDNDATWHLDYSTLPEDSVERLIALLEKEHILDPDNGDTSQTTEEATTEALKEESKEKTNEKDKDKEKTTEKTTEKSAKSGDTKATPTPEPEATAAPTANNTTPTTAPKKDKDKKTTEEKKKTTEEKKKTTEEKKKTTEEPTPEPQPTAEPTAEPTPDPTPDPTAEPTPEPTPHVHSWGDWETTQKATCTVDGTKVRTCSSCGEQESDVISRLGHNWVQSPVQGQGGYVCSRCGKTR